MRLQHVWAQGPRVSGTPCAVGEVRAATLCAPGLNLMSCESGAGAGAPGATSPPPAGPPPPSKKREARPKIDLDERIREARQRMADAAKAISEARAEAKNDRRKKARLVKKASGLNPEDLERIAVLKRCGLFVPAAVTGETGHSGASGSGSASSAAGTPRRADDEEGAPTEDEPDDAEAADGSQRRDADGCAPAT